MMGAFVDLFYRTIGKGKGKRVPYETVLPLGKEKRDQNEILHALQNSKTPLRIEKVSETAVPNTKPPKSVRFVCISDTHNSHGALTMPPGDVLIHSGDFTNLGEVWEVEDFNQWLGRLPYKDKIVIAGNHELTFDPTISNESLVGFGVKMPTPNAAALKALLTNCTYVEHASVVIEGVHIFATPYQPWFFDWAFNLKRGAECRAMWETIPQKVDVLVTHGPPLGHGDTCSNGLHAGCADLLDWCEHYRPRYHVFGHIHEGYGMTTNGATTFVNASALEKKMNEPIVFDYVLP